MDGERFALVTGAGSGVGKASALALAAAPTAKEADRWTTWEPLLLAIW